jgi:hypothetical protein
MPVDDRANSIEPMLPKVDLSQVFAADGFTHEQVATLRVRSGSVVAWDPMTLNRQSRPFTITVPSGDHLIISVNDFDAALLIFAEGRPVRWELAVLPGQDVAVLGPDEIFGYPVDTGFGSFVDAEGAALWCDECDALGDDVIWQMDDVLFGDDDSRSASHVIGSFRSAGDNGAADNPAGYNLVIFPAGLGDGVYATWVGLDPDDHPICLLTNFALTGGIS